MSEKLTRTQHQEPGTARRGQPGRPDVLAPAVRHPGRRLRGLVAGGAVAGGHAAPRPLGHGGGQAAAAGPAQGLLGHAAAEPAQPRRGPLEPVRAEDYATKEEELQAREDQAFKMVKAAMDAMGGVGQFIKKGDVVVIKPNVAFDKNPDLAATTQPDTVAAVVKLCLGAGTRKVIVADNPINNPESCFFKTKVGDAAVRAGAELMLPKDSYFEQLYVGGETITSTWRMFYRPFREATKVIGISPVKDHNLCKATVTMKNWYGLLGNPRNQFHQNIHGIISDFALMMKPTLVIADGRKLLMRNGPTGGSLNDVKRGDTIVVGTDHTAVDSWCVTRLLEKQRHEIIYLDKVITRGLGKDWRPQWTQEITVS